MITVIVLFNLKEQGGAAEYERWAREVDLPTAGALASIERFEVLKARGLLGGGVSPYQYVEILRVNDMARLFEDIAAPAMQKVSAQFQSFADNPLFIVTEAL